MLRSPCLDVDPRHLLHLLSQQREQFLPASRRHPLLQGRVVLKAQGATERRGPPNLSVGRLFVQDPGPVLAHDDVEDALLFS